MVSGLQVNRGAEVVVFSEPFKGVRLLGGVTFTAAAAAHSLKNVLSLRSRQFRTYAPGFISVGESTRGKPPRHVRKLRTAAIEISDFYLRSTT